MSTHENPQPNQQLNPKAASEAYLGGEGIGTVRYEALADLAAMTYYDARIAYFRGDSTLPISKDQLYNLATLAAIRETVRVRSNGENGQSYRQAAEEAASVLGAYEAETSKQFEPRTFGYVIRYESMPSLLHDIDAKY